MVGNFYKVVFFFIFMAIKTVFFDFDGTVSDAKGISLRASVETLREFGYEVDEGKLEELLGIKMKRILDRLGIEVDDVEEVRDRFYEKFIGLAVGGGVRPCCDLGPLWEMKGEGVGLVVVSNSRRDFLDASIKTLGIEGLFDEVYGADEFDFKDEMIKKLIEERGISGSEAIYVGDRFSDVEFARKAGCLAVAIFNECSFSSLEELERERPDYVVKDFFGLRDVVRKLNF